MTYDIEADITQIAEGANPVVNECRAYESKCGSVYVIIDEVLKASNAVKELRAADKSFRTKGNTVTEINKQEAIKRMAEAAYVKPIGEFQMADMESALEALVEYLPDLIGGGDLEISTIDAYVKYKQLLRWRKND